MFLPLSVCLSVCFSLSLSSFSLLSIRFQSVFLIINFGEAEMNS